MRDFNIDFVWLGFTVTSIGGNKSLLSEIRVSRGGEDSDCDLAIYCARLCSRRLPPFRRNVSPLSSTLKLEAVVSVIHDHVSFSLSRAM
jgi:hypothetical protein